MKKNFRIIKKHKCQNNTDIAAQPIEHVRAVEFEFNIDKPDTPVSKTIDVEVDVAEPEIIVEEN
ncbi:MAG TPA: hypothetical protein P5087_01295 [Eubacteriales bacterium]|nr:hypothetical protein [Eubacteriales bacterium]